MKCYFKHVHIEKSEGGGLTSQVLPDQTIDSRNCCQYKLQILNSKDIAQRKRQAGLQKIFFKWLFLGGFLLAPTTVSTLSSMALLGKGDHSFL